AVEVHTGAWARNRLAERDRAVVDDRRTEPERLDAGRRSRAGYGAVIGDEIVAKAGELDAHAAGTEIDGARRSDRHRICVAAENRDATLADGDIAAAADSVVVTDGNSDAAKAEFDFAGIEDEVVVAGEHADHAEVSGMVADRAAVVDAIVVVDPDRE